MRTYDNLYPDIYDFENLYNAYLKLRMGHRYDPQVLIFTHNLDTELIQLQNELIWKTYRTGKYREFYISDPKTRLIAVLPFKDRVLRHALCNVIRPIFEKEFIYDSYACRKGKGTHASADRVTEFLKAAEQQPGKVFCLKGDVEKYYQSVRHKTLFRIINKTIRCKDTLELIDENISSWADTTGLDPRGLPRGEVTSPLWGNVYLNPVDHLVKEDLRVPMYVRYNDDFIIISHSKKELWQIKREIEDYMNSELGLRLNCKTSIFPASQGIDFVGYRIWSDHRLLRKRSTKRIKRTLRYYQKGYAQGTVSLEQINATIQSWLGHAKHADTWGFREQLFNEFILTRENKTDE